MEVDEIDRGGRANSEDNDTSGFEVLVKSIKTLEKEAKTREQQLSSKLEQERLKWHQEKQDLLEQLRQKQSPYQVPKSPARPVLGAVTPNKQHGPPSKSSQATSDISFRDVFTSPSNKTHTSISHHVSPRHLTSPNRLEAELKAVKKVLKRVEHKYQALYEAQEEILRERNQDRDKWRHFKNVVKTATASRPDFQLELRKADALLKKQDEDLKKVRNDHVQSDRPAASAVSGTAVVFTSTKQSTGPTSLSTPTMKHSYARRTASEAEIQASGEPRSPSPRKGRQYSNRSDGEQEDGRFLFTAPTTSLPTSISKKATVGLTRSESPFTVSTQAAQPISSTSCPAAIKAIKATPVAPSAVKSSQLRKQEYKELIVERERRAEEYYFLEGNMDTNSTNQGYVHRESCRDDLFFDMLQYYVGWYPEFVLEFFEMDIQGPEDSVFAELEAFEKSEHDNDMQVLQRIYAEYEPIPCAKDKSPTKWVLDGRELVGPAIAPAAAVGAQLGQDEVQRPPTNLSQPSTVEDPSFWSEEGEFAGSAVESVPTEIEFGSYQPGTADSCGFPFKASPSQGGTGVAAVSQQELARNSGVPYLYPLPQDLQSKVPPDQDVLEESVPIRRAKVPRLSAFSGTSFAPIEEEKIWKPFESRSRRSLASSNFESSPPLQVAANSGALVKRDIVSRIRASEDSDDEATEASSSPVSQTEHQQPALVDARQVRDIEVGQSSMTGDTTPVTCAVPTTSTVKSNRDGCKEVISPTNQADKAPTFCVGIVSLDTLGQKGEAPAEDESRASSGEDEHLDGDPVAKERLPSYAPSQMVDERIYAIRKTITDEKIGPRRPSPLVKSTRKAETLVPATENFCETYLARVTGKGEMSIKASQAPLGKPIGIAQLEDTPKGTPTAWHNMSSKRRAPSTACPRGTPSSVTSFTASKRALSGAKVSSAAVIIASASPHQVNCQTFADTTIQGIKPLRGSVLMQRTSINHSLPKKETPSPLDPGSHPRPAAVEPATDPPKQPKAKRPRKSAAIPDAEVESNLQLVGNAIIRKTSLALGAKREAPPQAVSEEKPSKKSRKSLDGNASAERPVKKASSNSTASAASRRIVVVQNWVQRQNAECEKSTEKQGQESHSIKKQAKALQETVLRSPSFSDDATRDVKVKVEDTGDQGSENSEESEEFLGQRFMRKVHEERRKTMQADPLKNKGRGAYAAQVEAEPSPVERSEVAHKETIRGREARQAVHGVNCPCCTGYYEYKTRNLPLEERAKAAAEMVNEVSRHRQNWETAQSPPGYWQMGFPSTAQVERLNEEAAEMKKEKRERQRKEKAADNNCGGRRDYKVV